MFEKKLPQAMQNQADNARQYNEAKKRQNALEKFMVKFYDGNDVAYRSHQFQIFEDCLVQSDSHKEEKQRVYGLLYKQYFPALDKTIRNLNDVIAYPELHKDVKPDEATSALQEANSQMEVLLAHPPVTVEEVEKEPELAV